MQELCLATGEVPERVVVSVESTIDPRVLDHLGRYVLKKSMFEVSNLEVCTEISRKARTLMNDHVPNVGLIVATHLKMSLRERDIETRVLKYYLAFDRIIEDHGLARIIGCGPVYDEDGHQRMKARCKSLVQHIQSEVLRLDIERLVSLTHRAAKTDYVILYDLIVERGRYQQHFHLMQGEVKREGATPKKAKGASDKPQKPNGGGGAVQQPPGGAKKAKEPLRGGCLFFKGAHWLNDCPAATTEQKDDARRRWKG
jgi:hypothetical protein